MKFLLLLLVIVFGLWLVGKRLRGPGDAQGGADGARRPPGQPKTPQAMVECAHCGLHLPAADAVLEGRHVYCSEAHRLLGPRAPR